MSFSNRPRPDDPQMRLNVRVQANSEVLGQSVSSFLLRSSLAPSEYLPPRGPKNQTMPPHVALRCAPSGALCHELFIPDHISFCFILGSCVRLLFFASSCCHPWRFLLSVLIFVISNLFSIFLFQCLGTNFSFSRTLSSGIKFET